MKKQARALARTTTAERRSGLAAMREARAAHVTAVRGRMLAIHEAAVERRHGRRLAEPLPQRIEIHDPDRSSMMTGLAVGLAVVAVVGVAGVVVYLLLRKDGTVVAVPAPAPTQPTSGLGESAAAYDVHSYRLPALNMYEVPAVLVARAGKFRVEATVRAVSPRGEQVVLAFEERKLNQAGIADYPVGKTLIVPVGQAQAVELRPGQELWAKASESDTIVSVALRPLV